MNDAPLIEVNHISKKFCRNLRQALFYASKDLVKGIFADAPLNQELRKDEFWALEDVNFRVKRGEILGITGHNGSGKSTLLRLIANIFVPDRGEIITRGKILPLFGVNQGFHNYMSGIENIKLKGAILGMNEQELEEKTTKIIEFAGLEGFEHAAYSTYSAGMKARLGFSLAIHSRQDILLLDEVFARGDIEFKTRSYHKLKEIAKNSAVILVSHRITRLEMFCEQLLVLDHGKIACHTDNVAEGLDFYEELLGMKNEISRKL